MWHVTMSERSKPSLLIMTSSALCWCFFKSVVRCCIGVVLGKKVPAAGASLYMYTPFVVIISALPSLLLARRDGDKTAWVLSSIATHYACFHIQPLSQSLPTPKVAIQNCSFLHDHTCIVVESRVVGHASKLQGPYAKLLDPKRHTFAKA